MIAESVDAARAEALGLVHRGNGDIEAASTHFEQALTLYQQQQQPLGEADTHYERAGIFLEQEALERAQHEFSRAIALVERVMNTLRAPEQWRTFLGQYATLYAQAAITQVRRDQDVQARQLLSSFARIAGSAVIVQHIKAYEPSIPVEGEELSEAEILANQNLVKRLRQLRNSL